jgi:hypothetical protein
MSDSERLDKIAKLLDATESSMPQCNEILRLRSDLAKEAYRILELDKGNMETKQPPRKLVGFYLFGVVRLPIYEDQLEKIDLKDANVFIKPNLTEEHLMLNGPIALNEPLNVG